MKSEPLETRFWKYVEKIPFHDCWEWLGYKTKGRSKGYGTIHCVYENGKRIAVRAHRASWVLHKGKIPEGSYVCHSCCNRSCVNPDHLFLGTHWDKVDEKGRWRGAMGKHNIGKTHCPKGHLYSKENIQLLKKKNGKTARGCKICRRMACIKFRKPNLKRTRYEKRAP